MCDRTVLAPIPDHLAPFYPDASGPDEPGFRADHPEFGLDEDGRRCFRLDACIAPIIRLLWAYGVKTIGCCCGHGQPQGVISIDTGGYFEGGHFRKWNEMEERIRRQLHIAPDEAIWLWSRNEALQGELHALQVVASAASSALKSYAHGNSAPDLALSVARAVDAAIERKQ